MSLTCRLFCRLVSDHPNDKTAEWRISFVHKRTLFWKLFAFLQSIWCEIDACSRLFGLVCYRPNKKTAEIHGFILYLIRLDLEIIHQWEICWLFPFFFLIHLFRFFLWVCFAALMIWLFFRWAYDYPNEKNSRFCSKKERTHFWKCLQLFWGEMPMCLGCLFALSVIVETKKNSQYSLLHFGLKFV